MHEAALMKDLMARIEQVAADNDATRVTTIEVWLGALSHMTPEHFAEHFNDVAPGSCAEGARVVTEASQDIHHPQAQGVVLKRVEVES